MAEQLSPLAERFAAALEAVMPPDRSRARVAEYSLVFASTEPALSTSPSRRQRLADAIAELAEAGVLAPTQSLDFTERPPLPRSLVLLGRRKDPAVGREAVVYPWRPQLVWAARLPLRRSEFEALKAIQAFLRDRGNSAPIVPLGERSLELFGDEKRLDSLVRNKRLFAPDRLSSEVLRTRVYAPPFAWRRVGDGPVVLVVENQATFHSVIAARPADSPIGLVVFGGGMRFAASVAYLAELPSDAGIVQPLAAVRYFGDLDRRGLEIPIAAGAFARELGLPEVRPAIDLWSRLMAAGRRAPCAPVPAEVAGRLVQWLPAPVRTQALEVLTSGYRLAQEAVGTELLVADPGWADWPSLGLPD